MVAHESSLLIDRICGQVGLVVCEKVHRSLRLHPMKLYTIQQLKGRHGNTPAAMEGDKVPGKLCASRTITPTAAAERSRRSVVMGTLDFCRRSARTLSHLSTDVACFQCSFLGAFMPGRREAKADPPLRLLVLPAMPRKAGATSSWPLPRRRPCAGAGSLCANDFVVREDSPTRVHTPKVKMKVSLCTCDYPPPPLPLLLSSLEEAKQQQR